jgi:hypothetical protein
MKTWDSPRVTGLLSMHKTLIYFLQSRGNKSSTTFLISLEKFIEFLLPVIDLTKKHPVEMG